MTLPSTTPDNGWDERNDVEIRRIASASEIDHEAAEPYEYVVPGSSGGPLDVVALYVPKASKTLIVSFHGSLVRSKFQLPRFEWRRTLGNLDAGVLLMADTTLELGEKIQLGWYIGTTEQDLADEIAAVVKQVAADGGYEHIVLTGSSGGGYAAMAISRRIPGSVAVSFSPQTRVGDYITLGVQRFVNAAFPAYATIDAVEADFPGRVNLRRLYAEPEIPNYVRYVQNSNDLGHFEEHYAPFAEVRSIDPATGGMDPTGRFRFVLEPMSKGHEPPARHRFLRNIQEAHVEFFGEELEVSNWRGIGPHCVHPSRHRIRLGGMALFGRVQGFECDVVTECFELSERPGFCPGRCAVEVVARGFVDHAGDQPVPGGGDMACSTATRAFIGRRRASIRGSPRRSRSLLASVFS